MCGRYQLQASTIAIAASHHGTTWRPGHEGRHHTRQQLRPTNYAPVVVARQRNVEASPEAEAEVIMMRWGLNPTRSTPPSRPTLINARRETLLRLPTFRAALKRSDGSRRCAVPATGFYEWEKSPGPGKPTLTPYLIRHSNKPGGESSKSESPPVFYMAGLYDERKADGNETEPSFVIITTDACKQFSWLHDRQPVFLSSERAVDRWLDHEVTAEDAVAELRTENGLTWTRMVKDLSEAAKGRIMKQNSLDSLFRGKPGKKGKDHEAKQTFPSPKRENFKGKTNLKVAKNISKVVRKSGKLTGAKQKKLSSFFSNKSDSGPDQTWTSD